MPRFARLVVPDLPHHVTALGNRREPIFFEDGDHDTYRHILAEEARQCGVAVWAYCLMPNHVHLILVPERPESLGKAMGEAHRRYAMFVNSRARWSGHLFQDRFASVVMDEHHLLGAVRYVSLNPVRAGMVARAEDWMWSSVRGHLRGQDDGLVTVTPVLDRVPNFCDLISEERGAARHFETSFNALRAAERTGRPLGARDFVDDLERRLRRPLSRGQVKVAALPRAVPPTIARPP